MSIRLWSIVILMCWLASLATGCRPAPAPVLAAGDDVRRLDPVGSEVVLWHSFTGPAAEALSVLVDEFNSTNAWRIVVVPQYQGVYPALHNRIDDALDRHAAPDLAVLYPYHAAAYVQKGAAVTLDPYVTHSRWGLSEADRADIAPVFLNSDRNPQMGGQWVSFPAERSAVILYYNADWLKSLGYQAPPLTWPAFKEMCQRASVDADGDSVPEMYGYSLVPDATVFSALVLSRGGMLVSQDARQASFNSTEGVRAMNILRDTFPFRQAFLADSRAWDPADFGKAKTLFAIAPSNELPAYKAAVEQNELFRWGVAPLPRNTDQPVSLFVGQSWTVFKTTPQRQLAAWLFVRWFSGAQQTRRWAEATTTLPLRLSAAQAMNTRDIDPNIKTVLELLPFGQSEPAVPGWEAAREILGSTLRAVANGQAPATALERAETQVNLPLQ